MLGGQVPMLAVGPEEEEEEEERRRGRGWRGRSGARRGAKNLRRYGSCRRRGAHRPLALGTESAGQTVRHSGAGVADGGLKHILCVKLLLLTISLPAITQHNIT